MNFDDMLNAVKLLISDGSNQRTTKLIYVRVDEPYRTGYVNTHDTSYVAMQSRETGRLLAGLSVITAAYT